MRSSATQAMVFVDVMTRFPTHFLDPLIGFVPVGGDMIGHFSNKGRQRHIKACHPAQQDSCLTSLVKVWAQSLSPSTIVK